MRTFIFLLLLCDQIYAQKPFSKIEPIVGLRISSRREPYTNFYRQYSLLTSLTMGVRANIYKEKLYLEVSGDLNYEPQVNNDLFKSALNNKKHFFNYDAYMEFGKYSFGLGYFHLKTDNPSHYIIGIGNRDYHGLSLGYRRRLNGWLIEARHQMVLSYGFAGGFPGRGLYSIRILKSLNDQKASKSENNKLKIEGSIGSRFFINKSNSINLYAEDPPKIGVSPAVELNLFYKNWPIGISFSKDVWASINAGSPVRMFKGFVSNTSLGFCWQKQLKNERHFRLGLSYMITRDIELWEVLQSNPDGVRISNTYHQIQGLGLSVSYEIAPKMELEFRNNYPFTGRKPFEARLMTLGLFYRIGQ